MLHSVIPHLLGQGAKLILSLHSSPILSRTKVFSLVSSVAFYLWGTMSFSDKEYSDFAAF